MRLILLRDSPAEGWPSMDRYAESLFGALRKVAGPDWDMKMPEPPRLELGRYGQLLARIMWYPLWARTQRGEIVHILDQSYGHLLFAIARERSVITVHDVAPARFPHRGHGMSRLAWQMAWAGLRRACYVIADSSFTAQEIRTLLNNDGRRVHVAPLGVSANFQPFPESERQAIRQSYQVNTEYLLVHVGHCQPRKNMGLLVRILAQLRDRGLRVRLLQAGGQLDREHHALSQSLGVESALTFLGQIPDEALVRLYNAADAFVFPSVYEGFGLPVLEAMACGAPVIAARAASLPEVVGEAGLLLPADDPIVWADALCRLLRDRELAEGFRQRGLARAAMFTWESCARKTLSAYEEVLGWLH